MRYVFIAVIAGLLACGPARAEFATYYGGSDGYCGKRTASGEKYNCNGMTAAHRTLPFGTHLRVCGPGGCAAVRINDRGPFAHGASIDLSMAAARAICGGLKSCHVRMSKTLTKGDWGL